MYIYIIQLYAYNYLCVCVSCLYVHMVHIDIGTIKVYTQHVATCISSASKQCQDIATQLPHQVSKPQQQKLIYTILYLLEVSSHATLRHPIYPICISENQNRQKTSVTCL